MNYVYVGDCGDAVGIEIWLFPMLSSESEGNPSCNDPNLKFQMNPNHN